MNKKIIVSMFAIVAVATIAAVGSSAYWVDEENANADIEAGQMDLKVSATGEASSWVDVDADDVASTAVVTIENAYPGLTGVESFYVKNDGDTVDGYLNMKTRDLVSEENTVLEPETEADGGDNNSTGELCDEVEVQWVFGEGAGSISTRWASVSESVNNDAFWNWGNAAVLSQNGTPVKITANYRVAGDADNTIMTDSCKINIKAILTQVR